MDYNDLWFIRQWVIIDLDISEFPLELEPYQKLFLALLMDAVETLKRPPKAIVNRYIGTRQYKVKEPAPLDPIGEAYDWLMSDDNNTLGFVSICEYLKWDPGWIRKRALEAIEKAKANPEAPRRNNIATDGQRRRTKRNVANEKTLRIRSIP